MPHGVEIRIGARKTDPRILIEVEDPRPGIPRGIRAAIRDRRQGPHPGSSLRPVAPARRTTAAQQRVSLGRPGRVGYAMADRHRRRTSSPSAPAGADLVPTSLVFILSISLWFAE